MDLVKEYQMFSEVWKFYKNFYQPQNTSKYWENLMCEHKRIYNLYPTTLCKGLILAILDEIERRVRNEK